MSGNILNVNDEKCLRAIAKLSFDIQEHHKKHLRELLKDAFAKEGAGFLREKPREILSARYFIRRLQE